MLKSVIVLLCSLITCVSLAAPATTVSTKEASVKHLAVKINEVNRSLNDAKTQRSGLIQTLRDSEVTMDHLYQHLDRLQVQLQQQQTHLGMLEQQQAKQQQQLETQQQLLAKQFRAAYQLGEHETLKVLLNQQDPEQINRLLTYYGYLNRARVNLIVQIKQTIADLQQRQHHISQQTQDLQNLVSEQTHKRQSLKQHQTLRNQVLTQLNQQIISKQDLLQQLRANKLNLENVIQRLQATATASNFPQPNQPFANLHHHLPWPTPGPVTQSFGTSIAGSELRYNGIFIKANQGQAVRAIYPGRVVFANWLRGFGLLMIIDHGNGFMTLYAHNQSLYKQAGENTKAGDLISTVGHSGGNEENGLYFEVRYRGKPLDPRQWCSSGTIRAT